MPTGRTSRETPAPAGAAEARSEAVRELGQSLWMDSISRDLVRSGKLDALIAQGIRGMTSNPSLFAKALAEGGDYDADLARAVAEDPARGAKELYEALALADIRAAADRFRPLWEASGGEDGRVSLEVSPALARDTEGTVREARRLFAALDRPNAMIKVPGTPEGVPAIQRLTAEGIPVNVTLLFGLEMHAAVLEAYLAGLEGLWRQGGDLSHVSGVASFFLSRIDTLVDGKLAEGLALRPSEEKRSLLEGLRGEVALASARLAYRHFHEVLETPRWRRLAARGARPQRLLWASTSTKNPAYGDLKYVEPLIGPETVNTLPPATFEALLDHGAVRPTLAAGPGDAEAVLARLEQAGLDLKALTDELVDEGIRKFQEPFDALMAHLEARRRALLGPRLAGLSRDLGPEDSAAAGLAFADWGRQAKGARLWRGDPGLWSGGEEARWTGWMDLPRSQRDLASRAEAFARELKGEGLRHVVLLGMGGSSLAPWVFREAFGAQAGWPELRVLDSILPEQVRAAGEGLDPARTLFLVSSKSGTTTEPNVLYRHFRKLVEAAGGPEPGRRFVAITDPGSPLEALAAREGFRETFLGVPSVGGRYSALSAFGLVPAALMGLDAEALLVRTEPMAASCGPDVPPEANPGLALGLSLGSLVRRGRDKVTFLADGPLEPLGAWLEQLLAESTGKAGTGLVPVAGERPGAPEAYGEDRVFVRLRLRGREEAALDRLGAELRTAGHPLLAMELGELADLGQAFFLWEVAVAAAGSVLGIDPFDQPDVEASKEATRELAAAFEKEGRLPEDHPLARQDDMALMADEAQARLLERSAGDPSLEGDLAALLAELRPGDYLALNAFLPMMPAHQALLQELRARVRDATGCATMLGFGPRFLHSTGQLHKGGPNAAVVLELTADPAGDLEVPGQRASFGVLAREQALGDFRVLGRRCRRAVRVHLGPDAEAGLRHLGERLARALPELAAIP